VYKRQGQALSGLNDKIQKLNKTSGNIKGFQLQTQKLEGLRQKLADAQAKVKDFQTRRRQGEPIDPKAFTRANEEAARLRALVQENERALGSYRRELQGAGIDTSKLGSEQERLAAKIQQAQRAQERYNKVRSQLTWGNFKADLMKSTAIVQAFRQPITVAMNFDQAMAQVKAVLNPTEEEFTRLETQSKALGSSTQFSATQAANSQENLARAGFTVDKIINMMPEVLSVAAADGMDLAKAADIIGASLRGFNLEADQAKRIADILAYTSSHSATNVAMAGSAMQAIAGTARVQNITPEKIASYIGVLANYGGVQGTEAATTIERSITALAAKKGDAKKYLRQYRVATATRDGRMRFLEDIAAELYDKTLKLGPEIQQKVFSGVFGKSYGGNMMKFVMGVKAGELATLEKGITYERNGSAAAMAKTRNDTLKGDVTSLSSAWEGFMIRIGQPLDKINRFFTQTLTTVLQKATEFMNEHQGFFDLVIQSCYALGAIKIGATVYKYFSLGIEFLSSWRAVKIAEKAAELATAGANAGALAANMSGAAKGASLFGVSLHTALGWIGLIAFASYEIYQHWEDITAAAQRAGETISSIDTSKYSQAKAGTLSRGDADYGIAAMTSTYMPPEIPSTTRKLPPAITTSSPSGKAYGAQAHAFGGILTRPHIGLVAEAGPEAIIPLTDKSRGIPLVMRAAEILGIAPKFTPASILSRTASRVINSASTVMNAQTISPENSGNINSLVSTLSQGRQMINHVNNSDGRAINSNTSVGDSAMTFQPTYNITVTGRDDEERAMNFRSIIEDVMSEMMSRMERLSYA